MTLVAVLAGACGGGGGRMTANAQTLEYVSLDVSRHGVGGEAALIIAPTGESALIDAGAPTMGQAVIVPYLESRGITHLDQLWISHQDLDHIGGAAEVLAHISVGTLYLPAITTNDWLNLTELNAVYEERVLPKWQDMILTASQQGVEVVTVAKGDLVHLGAVRISVLQAYEMVMRVEWNAVTLMSYADATGSQLDALADTRHDVYALVAKVPHHGVGDTGFTNHLSRFSADHYIITGPERILRDSEHQTEAAALLATGATLWGNAVHGTIRFQFTGSIRVSQRYFGAFRGFS